MPNDLDTYSGDSNKQLTIKDIGESGALNFPYAPYSV